MNNPSHDWCDHPPTDDEELPNDPALREASDLSSQTWEAGDSDEVESDDTWEDGTPVPRYRGERPLPSGVSPIDHAAAARGATQLLEVLRRIETLLSATQRDHALFQVQLNTQADQLWHVINVMQCVGRDAEEESSSEPPTMSSADSRTSAKPTSTD